MNSVVLSQNIGVNYNIDFILFQVILRQAVLGRSLITRISELKVRLWGHMHYHKNFTDSKLESFFIEFLIPRSLLVRFARSYGRSVVCSYGRSVVQSLGRTVARS